MLHQRSNNRQQTLFWLALIPLCLFIGSFLFLNSAIIGYIKERHNTKLYLNTTCFLNGTITFQEPCKDDICYWPVSSGLCPSTFRLCLKTVYVIVYGNNHKAFTDRRPPWADDEETDTTCYYDKTKSGIVQWEKPKTKKFRNEIVFGIFVLAASIILWIVWAHIKKTSRVRVRPMTNNQYYMVPSEL